jgi:hypothetical protein
MKRLIEGIEHKARVGYATYPPTDDAPSEGVYHEGDANGALPGGQ